MLEVGSPLVNGVELYVVVSPTAPEVGFSWVEAPVLLESIVTTCLSPPTSGPAVDCALSVLVAGAGTESEPAVVPKPVFSCADLKWEPCPLTLPVAPVVSSVVSSFLFRLLELVVRLGSAQYATDSTYKVCLSLSIREVGIGSWVARIGLR
jgi:hypothetical protein